MWLSAMNVPKLFVAAIVLLAASSESSPSSPRRHVHVVAPNPKADGWATLFAPSNRAQLASALQGVSYPPSRLRVVPDFYKLKLKPKLC